MIAARHSRAGECARVLALFVVAASGAAAQAPSIPPAAAQNPSPMVESTRSHERVAETPLAGTRRSFAGPLGKPVELFVPAGTRAGSTLKLVVHFHGAAFLPHHAVSRLGAGHIAAVVHLAPGSGVYDRTFTDPAVYDSLLAGVARETAAALGGGARITHVTLSGFSAGHGAIRAILREPRHFARVDAMLLLDGLHTGYVPDTLVLARGGTVDESRLDVFVRYARAAARGEKRMLVTHSEIFAGTFASTTETTDYLVRTLALRRTPVLAWGPVGMQQLSEVRQGRLEILGFAGNSAPDHSDHFHAMPQFLARLLTAAGDR